ncbi:transposase [Synechocystis sp. PCC 6803]|uniref:Transposase n=1 Tax=Synechocystis sp. (strain ATCC 27184 / PCC 6803 / Kazusa) TaxID=1111708 RepID=P74806_SYNY3|nr:MULTISPECIES: transposase [unclassified Synechocystis]BAL30520.1 transposase [Synechocystis sp. PCC 6803 substr. GT-I]BAL33689.1 transposase [Synechocystis sp. PCC 6803 substr. PCC-N]BAL36858.1 transposase [Synechocystis sp. PCC 6803 substr. PCC-P]BAM53663.1 transposase [Synechocystis sp. PCC 6803] [Bacillus subtilis BEST7613]AGF53028.1 transposase [Synechocystis sp. PCC 6803]
MEHFSKGFLGRVVIGSALGFDDEDSVFELLYLTINNITKKWQRSIQDWRAATSNFAVLFFERFSL